LGNRSSRRPRFVIAEDATPRWHGRVTFILLGSALSTLVPAIAVAATAAGATGQAHVIAAETQRFLLFYAGVFALIALTAAVGAGLLATDRIFLSPGHRVLAQAVHRAISLVALSALATHIMLEVIAGRAQATDAVMPFLAARANFYMGVGTVASDLFVLIIVTGMARRKFAGGSRQWVWRVLHTTVYLCWPLAVLHGLLAGRAAKPYVDWSYGACLAAAGLVMAVRFVATVRGPDVAAQPVPDRASWPMAAQAILPGPAGQFPAGQLRQPPGPPYGAGELWQAAAPPHGAGQLPGPGRQLMPPQLMPPQLMPPQLMPPQLMPPQLMPPQLMPPQLMPPQLMPPQPCPGPEWQ
jgi:hypothetical protein